MGFLTQLTLPELPVSIPEHPLVCLQGDGRGDLLNPRHCFIMRAHDHDTRTRTHYTHALTLRTCNGKVYRKLHV